MLWFFQLGRVSSPDLLTLSSLKSAKVRILQHCAARSYLHNSTDVSPARAKNKFARVRDVICKIGDNAASATCRQYAAIVEGQEKRYIRFSNDLVGDHVNWPCTCIKKVANSRVLSRPPVHRTRGQYVSAGCHTKSQEQHSNSNNSTHSHKYSFFVSDEVEDITDSYLRAVPQAGNVYSIAPGFLLLG